MLLEVMASMAGTLDCGDPNGAVLNIENSDSLKFAISRGDNLQLTRNQEAEIKNNYSKFLKEEKNKV